MRNCKSPFGRSLKRSAVPSLGVLLLAVWLTPQLLAQERPFDTRVIESGHSLTDPIPPMLTRMVRVSGGNDVTIAKSTIPGSPLEWRWDHATDSPDARIDIAKYQVLVTTERTPLSNTLPWHNSEKLALRWFEHAWKQGDGGKGAVTVLYATWVTLDSGPGAANPYNDPEAQVAWRDRLPLEITRWEQIADYVNANRPAGSPSMLVIPGPQIMAAIHDAIADGSAPELKSISDLFTDSVHLNELGAYAIALAHYAVVYERDPRGLPADLGQATPPSPALAKWLQDLVWTEVTTYGRSGVTDTVVQ